MSYELLVEVTRNDAIESRHFGSAVVCDFQGNVVKSWGDVEGLIFPRSAIKPMLAIQLIESGASDHFSLTDTELSLACSSHHGESIHQIPVKSWLKRIGLDESQLACGAVLPDDIESAQKMLASGERPGKIHHTCSGKHTGYLTTALHLSLPIDGYQLLEHPLQQSSLALISDMAGVDLKQYPIGIDGCGFPATTLPLRNLGIAAARFANPIGLSVSRVSAINRIKHAMTSQPLCLAGHETFVSDIAEVTKGAVLAKTGAEGVIIAVLSKQGLGVAVKIADGNDRASPVALMAILECLGVLSEQEKQQLQSYALPKLLNSRAEIVGEIRSAI